LIDPKWLDRIYEPTSFTPSDIKISPFIIRQYNSSNVGYIARKKNGMDKLIDNSTPNLPSTSKISPSILVKS
jgi:hypothetical protein